MDMLQAIKSMRAVRQYAERSVDDEALGRILEAGRWTGSAKNTQPWQFVVIKKRDSLNRLAKCGNYASHLREAALAIAVVSEAAPPPDFDCGRLIQNMMLAAWGDGVGSCVASMHHQPEAKQVLGIPERMKLYPIIALGYPRTGVEPTIEGQPLKSVLAATGRRALAEMVHYEHW